MKKEKREKILLIAGIILILTAILSVGISLKISENRIGDEIREYNCQIIELDEGADWNAHKNRNTYRFNATVEVNGQKITLTSGNNKHYMNKYNQGDMITVYEYNGEYSFAKSDFFVTGVSRIIGIFGFAFGLCCFIGLICSKLMK